MKIVLTGGGTGGHFYPLIAVAERIRDRAESEKLFDVELYYLADSPYSTRVLYEHKINFIPVAAGKRRLYFSLQNLFDPFKTIWGIFKAVRTVYSLYPDVIFSKGSYASFPTTLAARILGIPVIIHETDSVPGRANAWAGKFARKIFLSYESAAALFPKGKTEVVGNPIRKEMLSPITNGAHDFFKLDQGVPTIYVVGGSSGAQAINNVLLDILPELVKKYQVIHQTGKLNFDEVTKRASVKLEKSEHKNRYAPVDYLDETATRMAAGIADLVITRAGGSLFEIAIWRIPAIVVPIHVSNGDHQRKNAYAYARAGAGEVIEEPNLTPHLLLSEIERIIENRELREEMKKGASAFAKPDAAQKIADELLKISLDHEQ